jgi:hypothetical protein
MHANVPDDVRWLVQESLPAMEHVEVLLLLARREGTAMTVREILDSVTINAALLPPVLARLVEGGLAVRQPGESPSSTRYSYVPVGLRERGAVQSLIRTYDTRPVSLIRYIYERPSDSAKLFADAFRLRKDHK